MTQIRWRITTALLLSALMVGASQGEEKPAPEQAPKKECPVLSKIPYINRLFKNVTVVRTAPNTACPCKPDKPCDGCCCSDKTQEPAMRCCPVTGVCCPAKPTAPVCMPPAAPLTMASPPCTLPAPVAMPVPPVGMYPCMPMPAPAPSYGMYAAVPPPAPDCGDYLVELKVMESRPGEEEKLVPQPPLMVVAGQPASLCCPLGSSFCAVSSGQPQRMIGEQGVDVCVIPAGPRGHVFLDVTIHKTEQDSKEGRCYVERYSDVRMCKQVKLGKTVKLPCDVPSSGEKIHWRIEATVKKASPGRDVRISPAPPIMPMCSEPCPCPKPMDAPVCNPITPVDVSFNSDAGATGSIVVNERNFDCVPATACCTEPAKKPFPKMTLSVRNWEYKTRVEVRSGDACVLCEQTVLLLSGSMVKVTLAGRQVSLVCEETSLKARADRVSTAPNGCLLLEGHVHVEGAGEEEVIEIHGGKVRLKLPELIHQTGVISSPTLVQ